MSRPQHEERVIVEQGELAARVYKLEAFIDTDPIFATLPPEERARLERQLLHMIGYNEALQERIKAFGAIVYTGSAKLQSYQQRYERGEAPCQQNGGRGCPYAERCATYCEGR